MPLSSDPPPKVLAHDPVAGYPRLFWLALIVMGGYLLVVLASSPGAVKTHGSYGTKKEAPAEGPQDPSAASTKGTDAITAKESGLEKDAASQTKQQP